MDRRIRWGIVGPGRIARKFVEDLQLVEDGTAQAVASRSLTKAEGFAGQHGIPSSYGSYDELFRDDEVDIVYIATPHDSHARLAVDALKAGRAVLCEKPVALSRQQAETMVEASRESGQFFMEGFWSRFIPAIRESIDLSRSGQIGDINYVNADFSFRIDGDPESRLLNMDLGGGALLDVGVYPMFLAYAILGLPTGVSARAKFHATGADLQTGIVLEYEDALATLYAGFASRTNVEATISGTKGRIVIDPMWHCADSYTVHWNDDSPGQRTERPRRGLGFTYEINECHECLRRGAIESDFWSHQDCLNLIGVVDQVREIIGLHYPE